MQFDPDIDGHRTSNKGYEKRSATESKSFNDLFGSGKNTLRWNDSNMSIFQAIAGGRYHPQLSQRSLNEGTPSDGKFLIDSDSSQKIFDVALESSIIFPRAQIMPMSSYQTKLAGFEIGSHATNLAGGFSASWTSEEESITESQPKVRMMTLNAHKLAGFCKISNELLHDYNGTDKIIDLLGAGISWYREDAYFNGTTGMPQGILNSPCKITITKETGQSVDTVVLENINKLLASLYSGGYKNAVWICSQSVLPQLLQLSLAIGVAGSASKVLEMGPDGNYTMYGLPVFFSEHCPTLGDAGDVNLVDLSQYLIGVSESIHVDKSEHVFFQNDQTALRVVTRTDGMFLWDEPLTLKSGAEVSPMISLGERA